MYSYVDQNAQESRVAAATSFVGDFETGDLSGWSFEKCCSYSIQVVDTVARSGNYAVHFELRRDDTDVANSKRSELKKYDGRINNPDLAILLSCWGTPNATKTACWQEQVQ